MFRHFRNEQRTVPDMCPAIVLNLGLLLGTCQSANGQIFPPVPKNNPRSLCEGYFGPVARVNCCIIGILLFLITGPRVGFDRVFSQK